MPGCVPHAGETAQAHSSISVTYTALVLPDFLGKTNQTKRREQPLVPGGHNRLIGTCRWTEYPLPALKIALQFSQSDRIAEVGRDLLSPTPIYPYVCIYIHICMCIYRHKPIICSKRVCQERSQVKARQKLGGREGRERCRSKQGGPKVTQHTPNDTVLGDILL